MKTSVCAPPLLVLALVLCLAGTALAQTPAAAPGSAEAPPSGSEADREAVPLDAEPADPGPSGRDIYERVLANRYRTLFQKQRLVSRDAGRASSAMELWTRWKDGRDENGKTKGGVLSKTLTKYTSPRSVRGTGYLIVQKDEPPNDQFVYFPSARRVRRVNLGEAIMGTDYSIEDIVPRELETAEYERDDDEQIDGTDCYVVDLLPLPDSGSQYSKLRSYVEKDHYVVIRTDYWNRDGLEIKRFAAPAAEIEQLDGIWLVRQGTMANVVEGSSTTLEVLEMEPNAKIRDAEFSQRKLEQKSR